MGDKTLTLVFSNTCHTCLPMPAFLQGNEYLHTCYCSHSILLRMYVSEPRAERLGWTTYRALRYIRTCTYVCRGSSVFLNITHKIADSGNTLPTQCTTMGGKTLTLVFSNTCHTCPLMSPFLQVMNIYTSYFSHNTFR